MRIVLLSFFILILFAIAFIFATVNNQVVDLNYLIAVAKPTVAQMVSLFTGIGFFLGLLTALLWKFVSALGGKKSSSEDIKVS
ncbi:DUF1049 domain-containing protein [Thalassomonas haliotis]|uniref:DUF1049 domain-containing protein n=1 Tax=Thalassomonas haliotis TaxID=485448 RepID=A0ABY7V9A1_9GAMM|nr:DUF1049 domain-containing protein [Thalassomonas haliotis]WDE09624.1 DUF1049 domain-containing protein [Thalassomonas haliotis]